MASSRPATPATELKVDNVGIQRSSSLEQDESIIRGPMSEMSEKDYR